MKTKYTSLFLFLISILFIMFFVSSTSATDHETLKIDWEEFNYGVTSGGGLLPFFDWTINAGDDFYIKSGNVIGEAGTRYLNVDDGSGGTLDSGFIYFDFDDTVYIKSFEIELTYSMDLATSYCTLNFYEDDLRVCTVDFVGSPWERTFNYYNTDNTRIHIAEGISTSSTVILNVTHTTGNELIYTLYNNEFVQLYQATGTSRQVTDWEYFNKLRIATHENDVNYDIGNITINQTGYVPTEEGDLTDLNFKVYDRETGHIMSCFGHDTIKNVDNYYLYTELHSDLWEGDYNSHGMFGQIISIENLNLSDVGEWHFFNMSYIVGFIDPDIIYYYNSTNYLLMYPDQTYTIYVSSVSDYGGYSSCNQGAGWFENLEFGDPGFRQICTDKEYYTQGESINMRYVAPDPTWLYDYGSPASSYFIWIYDDDYFNLWTWFTDGGVSADNYAYMSNWAVSLDNNYHYLHWDFDPTETFGYKAVTGGVDSYSIFIGHGSGGLFGIDYWLCRGGFTITTGSFTPHGNISSVSPSEPKLGQFVNISFEANNNGYLTVKNVLAPGDTEQVLTNFQKFTGIEHINRQFFEFGSYELKLYVSGGTSYEVVDTYNFDITDVNGSYGDFGFGIEFLMVEPARVIAGYDVVFISYRSLDTTGEIKVLDARGQTTSYGSIVGEKRGVLNITLPNHAAIGEWNITLLTANNTLYSSFNVIAEENNWVEFYSNVYYENEQFELKLKHDKKVEVVFSKDGQETGTDWYLDVGIFPGGIYSVPIDTVTLSPGIWKVELYEVNNFVKKGKLAEDTCVVIETPAGDITEGGTGDIFQILTSGASSIAEGSFGLAFMAIIFVLVVVVSLAQMKLKNDTIFFGGILMALFMAYIGWLPVWIVIISIVIAGFLFSSAFTKKLGIGS